MGVAALGTCDASDRREVSMYGHPAPVPEGLWVTARVLAPGGPHQGWIQLEGANPTSPWIEAGFSGSGVWDPVARRIVGMVIATYRNTRQDRAAWMLPMQAAARLWPPLAPLLGGPAPPTPRLDGSAPRTPRLDGSPEQVPRLDGSVP